MNRIFGLYDYLVSSEVKNSDFMILSRIYNNVLRVFTLYNRLNFFDYFSFDGLIGSNVLGKNTLVFNIVVTSRLGKRTPANRLDLSSFFFGLINSLLFL
jgi:hypothetical protein